MHATDGNIMDVNVVSHSSQKYSAWLGGSIVASDSRFQDWMKTKEQYEEEGPRIARHSAGVFNTDFM
jgi:actin-related protein 3